MNRRFLKNRRALPQPKLDLTALFDIIFILVLFFAVSTSFQQERKGLTLTLPSATSVEKPSEAVTISIDRNQRLYWDGVRIEEANISAKVKLRMAKNPDQQIILQADQQTPYLRVVSVLDAIRQSGCSQVMLETKKT